MNRSRHCSPWMRHPKPHIVFLLNDGFKYNQILKKVRDGCRATDTTHTRLYYITTRDMRTIAIRNKLVPARRHDVDAESVEIRVREENIDDGTRLYIPATYDAGEGFVLVITTSLQKTWLKKYASRGVSVYDTFNLTPYSPRLAMVVVADEWDMGLPAAYLLSHRMTENEVASLFKEIKNLLPNFDTSFFMTDDTNSFWNGFPEEFPHSVAKKLLCTWHISQSVERNARKMKQMEYTTMIVAKVSVLCRTANPQLFASRYTTLLTFL